MLKAINGYVTAHISTRYRALKTMLVGRIGKGEIVRTEFRDAAAVMRYTASPSIAQNLVTSIKAEIGQNKGVVIQVVMRLPARGPGMWLKIRSFIVNSTERRRLTKSLGEPRWLPMHVVLDPPRGGRGTASAN